jgi:hypothetical protein
LGDSTVPACGSSINSAPWMHRARGQPVKSLMAFECPIGSGLHGSEFQEQANGV